MKRELLWKVFFFCLALVLVSVILYSGLQILESTVLLTPQQMEVQVRKTVTKDGVDYYPRQDITTVLVMGIDQTGPVQISQDPYGGKAVDMVTVVIVDESKGLLFVLLFFFASVFTMGLYSPLKSASSVFVHSHTILKASVLDIPLTLCKSSKMS